MNLLKKAPKEKSEEAFEALITFKVESITKQIYSADKDVPFMLPEKESALLKDTEDLVDKLYAHISSDTGSTFSSGIKFAFAHNELSRLGNGWEELYEQEKEYGKGTDLSRKALTKISDVLERSGKLTLGSEYPPFAGEWFFGTAWKFREVIDDIAKVVEDRENFAKVEEALADYAEGEKQPYLASIARKSAEEAGNDIIPGIGFLADKSKEEERVFGQLIATVPIKLWKAAEEVAKTKSVENGGVYAIMSTMNPVEDLDKPFSVFSIDRKDGELKEEKEITPREFFRGATEEHKNHIEEMMNKAVIALWAVPTDHPVDMPMNVVERGSSSNKHKFIQIFEGIGMREIGIEGYPICTITGIYRDGEVDVRMKIKNDLRRDSTAQSLKNEYDALSKLHEKSNDKAVWDKIIELNDRIKASESNAKTDWTWGLEKTMGLFGEAR